ncbi:hypothetical protein [Methanobrevibacter millerae]|uniref:Uncharacterized protein n=1 Tax=Methanobrevibacter millerae TaxID=230361 RepID=A0A1G5X3N9_9EURY|nr:hypothetical protein [Methanobrevibacter millerae]SDA65039.1 hypothetical protein SAMN02910315_01937 [Methanobrevibacter millerae]
MLCNISISTINDENQLTIHKSNCNVNLFYPFINELMLFDTDEDFLHDEFCIRLSKEDLNQINTSNIKEEDKKFLNEISELFNKTKCKSVEIDGRFRRFIQIGELN